MNRDIRLYIANKRVDLTDELSLPMNYQLEDFSNPTIIKNGFSKTISIPGTKNNNKLFGEIYKLDRMQHYEEWTGGETLSRMNFDPSKRTDFQIFKDGELMESGYMQLNDISIDGKAITYNITLYGGLGDFFYNLKYNEDGTTKTLADLRYFIEDDNGNVLPADSELDFTINKELVYDSFMKDYSVEGNKLTDTIAFLPAYNGLYDDFDSSRCLVNTNGLHTQAFPRSVTESGVTYTTKNGFGEADLENDYTEWQMKDLRSYHQRPAIKVSKLVKAICREENSGYKVTFDNTFFNDRNPYWSKTFVALPLLTSNDYDASTEEFNSVGQFNTDSFWFGANTTERNISDGIITVNGQHITVGSDGVIDLSALQSGSKLNLSVNFQLFAHPTNTSADTLYMYYKPDYEVNVGGHTLHYTNGQVYQWHTVQLVVVNADTNEELAFSSAYQFEDHKIIVNNKPYILQLPNGAAVSLVNGSYKRDGNRYFFQSNEGGNTWNLKVNDCPIANRVKIILKTYATKGALPSAYLTPEYKLATSTSAKDGYFYWAETAIESASGGITVEGDVTSGKPFSKATLLKTEQSPTDFLLNYTKLFGLYFIKDIAEKSIFICTRNTFFNGKVNDWTKRIDYLKNITVTPILFDKKYYMMALDTPATKYATRYKSQYNQEYGQQRLSTGYNFNYDTYNLYGENTYQQTIPAIDSNRFYRNFYDKSGNIVPSFVNDNCTFTLWSEDEETSVDIYGANVIGSYIEWNAQGRDIFAKQCFFSGDYDLQEIESSLVMWNGLKRVEDSNGNIFDFWLTDDLDLMGETPCYIFTENEYDASGNRIAIQVNRLPQYINCLTDSSSNVSYSLDFGLPKEIYFGNYAYSEDATVYSNFWKAFYNDQFHIDTKKITCFVKLDRMNQSYLREFYWFENAIWILNKVDSYDVTNDNTVRCEFIKCQDVNNYTNGQTTF